MVLVRRARRTKGADRGWRPRPANDNWKLDDPVRRVLRENVAAGLWVALLIAAGTLVLNALAESARREECLMRGGASCQNAFLTEMGWSQRGWPAPKEHVGAAAHLKSSRQW